MKRRAEALETMFLEDREARAEEVERREKRMQELGYKEA